MKESLNLKALYEKLNVVLDYYNSPYFICCVKPRALARCALVVLQF